MDQPRHARWRAVAGTDALITQAEHIRAAQALVLHSLVAAGHNTRRAAMLLHIIEERLERLRTSRQLLISGEFAAERRRRRPGEP
jgi:hypothetical protein